MARLANKYGFDECKRRLEAYIVGWAAAFEPPAVEFRESTEMQNTSTKPMQMDLGFLTELCMEMAVIVARDIILPAVQAYMRNRAASAQQSRLVFYYSRVSPQRHTMELEAEGGNLELTADLLLSLCNMGMRSAAAALAPLYVRALAQAARGDYRAPLSMSRSKVVPMAAGYVRRVIAAVGGAEQPAALSIVELLSGMLLDIVARQA